MSQDDYSIQPFRDKNTIEALRKSLLKWFALHGRHWIPWKLNKKGALPKEEEIICVYSIFVAEVMLQQTQLDVVLPYWKKWMITFPNLEDLAQADFSDVLISWQGLGYYSRARRIHEASKILLKNIGREYYCDLSKWPNDLNTWIALPGIGKSTAGSIISSAFNLPTPLLDGNVKRIFSRLINSKKPVSNNISELWNLSNLLLDYQNPRDFNQALMDLGATICTPKSPLCKKCPLRNYCFAYNYGKPSELPIKQRKKPLNKFTIGIGLLINSQNEVLIDQRLKEMRMGGMWEFPGGKQEENESIQMTIMRELQEELSIKVNVKEMLVEFDHLYSHQKLHFVVHLCELVSGNPKPLSSSQIKWVKVDDLVNYSFPAANRKMIAALKEYLIDKDN